MKVWGTTMYFNKNGRQCRAVVATKTKYKAAKLFGLSTYTFNNYSCETGNEKEIEWAMKNPETVVVMEVY